VIGRIFCAAILIALLGAVSADAAEPDDLRMVWHPSAECPDRKQGAGSTPATAIKLDDFDELDEAALDAMDSDDGAAKEPPETPYECRFVTLTGLFKWTDYYHYRGNLYKDLPAAYFGGPGKLRYVVENFADKTESRARLNGALVTLTGRFYDLCRRAGIDIPKGEDEVVLVFGPCHYGRLNGLMLRDVTIDRIEAGPNLRITGERNRGIIGDLAVMPRDWSQTKAVKQQFGEWLDALKSGRESYWRALQARSTRPAEEKAEELADILADPDDWTSFLTDSDASPLKDHSNAALLRRPFAVFTRIIRDEEHANNDPSEVTACACLKRQCAEDWPLFESDALRFADAYLCTQFERDRDGAWRWLNP
jgi:hypothetical protein